MPSNTINGSSKEATPKGEQQTISDIYIGVFFDGTNNNMNRVTQKDVAESTKKEDNKKLYERYIELSKSKEETQEMYRNLSSVETLSTSEKLRQSISELIEHKKKVEAEERKLRMDLNKEVALSDGSKESDRYRLKLQRDERGKYKNYSKAELSNIAFLSSLYQGKIHEDNNTNKVLNVYMEGSGATAFSNDRRIIFDEGERNFAGLALGIGVTGVVAIVSRAMLFITRYLDSLSGIIEKENVNLHFDVFGFSRGATCARVFTYMVCNGINSMPRGKEFNLYLAGTELKVGENIVFLSDYKKKTVDFLGIYDTVSSIGMLELPSNDLAYHHNFVKNDNGYYVNELYNKLIPNKKGQLDKDNKEGQPDKDNKEGQLDKDNKEGQPDKDNKEGQPDKENKEGQPDKEKNYFSTLYYTRLEVENNFHRANVKNYGLYSPGFTNKVNNVLHIGAMDEYRENFAFVNLGKEVPSNAVEVMIPGCHSDIGGGYTDDSANLVSLIVQDKSKKITTISLTLPGVKCSGDLLSVNVLKNMGWVWVNGKKHNIVSNSYFNTYSKEIRDDKTINSYNSDVIQFWDQISRSENKKSGYSNIPLRMMIDYAEKKLARDGVFVLSEHPRIKIPEELSVLAGFMVKNLLNIETGRYVFTPGDFISNGYNYLRHNYLHFSASDEFNGGLHFKTNWGNIKGANIPYRKYGILGRLMYMGGENDDNGLYFLQSNDCEFNLIKIPFVYK